MLHLSSQAKTRRPGIGWSVLLCLAVLSVACVDSGQGRVSALLEAGRARADLLALSMALAQAADGHPEGLATVRQMEPPLQTRMLALRDGDATRGIAAAAAGQRELIERAWLIWGDVQVDLQQVLTLEEVQLEALDSAAALSALLPRLQQRLQGLLGIRTEGSESTQVLRCMLMVERLQRKLAQLSAPQPGRMAAAEELAREAADLTRCIELLRGPRVSLDLAMVEIEAGGSAGGASPPTDVLVQIEVDALVSALPQLAELDERIDRLQQDIGALGSLLDELAAGY